MANIAKYNARVVMKHDVQVNWDKATNFVPLEGEIIVYDDLNKIKIGDGITNVINLPFVLPTPADIGLDNVAHIDVMDNENITEDTIIEYLNKLINAHNSSEDAHNDIRIDINSLSSEIANKLPKSGGTIKGTSGDTALNVQSASAESWISYTNNAETKLGYIGFAGVNAPAYYPGQGSGNQLLLHAGNYTNYVPSKTENWTFTLENGETITKEVYIK